MADLWTGRMSFRKLRVLLDGLPEDSLTWSEVRDSMTPKQRAASQRPQGHGRWSRTDHLLAGILDAVQIGNWQYIASNAKQPPAIPKPLRRPGVGDNVIPITDEAAELLERIRANHGAVEEG